MLLNLELIKPLKEELIEPLREKFNKIFTEMKQLQSDIAYNRSLIDKTITQINTQK